MLLYSAVSILKVLLLFLIFLERIMVESAGHDMNSQPEPAIGTLAPTGRMRLANGGSRCAGRVEVRHDGRWGAVFDSGWDIKDAAVVCKELGCGEAMSTPGDAHFGKGLGLVVTFDVQCRGNESTLRECPSDPWRHYVPSQDNDAAVICSGSLQKPTINLKPDFRVFERGERAEISCSGNHLGSKFSFYRNDQFITSQPAPENKTKATIISSEISTGSFWCRYTRHVENRDFTSPESKRVEVSRLDPLQKPNISMKPDSQVLMRGEHTEISCAGNYPGSNFSLYRDGEFVASQLAPENNNSATFNLSWTSKENYSCQYTTNIGGREFTSPESERVRITVSGYWNRMKIINSVRISLAIVVLIVTIVVLVLECRTMKTDKSQEMVIEESRQRLH